MAPMPVGVTYAEWLAVYNALSFGIAGMGSCMIFVWLQIPNVKAQFRTALIITGLVVAIATYHYVRIFNSWNAAYTVTNGGIATEDYTVTLSGEPFNDAYRYVDWLLTVPLLLIELLCVMGLPADQTASMGWKLGLSSAALDEISSEVDGKVRDDVEKYHKTFWKRHNEIADYDRIIKKIEAGEDKIHRRLEIERILKSKVSQSKDPFNQLKLNYGQNKGKAFNEEEDRYMICMTEKLGYGNWEDLKAEIRAAWQFRFDWFIKSRTPTELGRRVDTLIRLIEKEEPSEHSGKRKGYDDGGGSSKKSKA